jgi:hypothetical protein
LCWQHPKAGGYHNWQSAIDYCENLEESGHSDWRLPSKNEVSTLLGNCSNGVVDGIIGYYCDSCEKSDTCPDEFISATDKLYWTSTSADSGTVWNFKFSTGMMSMAWIELIGEIRCVRPGL